MTTSHLRFLSCSWPRPVECRDQRWISEPEWSAPLLPWLPQPETRAIEGADSMLLDWRTLFGRGVGVPEWHHTGEMKEFHVVFRLRAERSGTVVFHDDDGCIVRVGGEVVHEDRGAHPLRRHELRIRMGDLLEIAHWQFHGDWIWAGRIEPEAPSLEDDVALFAPFAGAVESALRHPNGPVLKTYFAATHPVRAALAVQSLILNGYRPAAVKLYGDDQWSAQQRRRVEALLPFAEIVPTFRVLDAARALHPALVPIAQSVWSAMKICVSLFHPPFEYCFVDDDVYVVDRMDDGLALFRDHDLVYQCDWDHGETYRDVWRIARRGLATGRVNTGVYFARNRRDRREQAARIVRNPPDGHPVWLWEQGFVATEFDGAPAIALPTQRYFYPIFDGLPGGVNGYDWGANPCGFAAVHFGGLANKPSEGDARAVVHEILGRRSALDR